MPPTDAECKVSGIYVSTCADRTELAVAAGQPFPPCARHGTVMWTLVRATPS
jgi:hypothetical protein